jgi:hypothetical protein
LGIIRKRVGALLDPLCECFCSCAHFVSMVLSIRIARSWP